MSHLMKDVTKLQKPLQLETAGGDLSIATVGDLTCGSVVCRGYFLPGETISLGFLRKLLHFLHCSCLARWKVDTSAGTTWTLNISGEDIWISTRVHHVHVNDHANSETPPSGRRVDGRRSVYLTAPLPLAYNGSEELLVAMRRGTRCCFVKALPDKRSDTVMEAMVDVQLLLPRVLVFHSDEGRELMCAVDSWLRKHAVLDTTTGAYDPREQLG